MQKYDFVQHLKVIVEELKSKEIVALFEEGFKEEAGSPKITEFGKILPVLFSSKGNYEKLLLKPDYAALLEKINVKAMYSDEKLAKISTRLPTVRIYEIFKYLVCVQMYVFHKSLLETNSLAESLLLSDLVNKGYEASMNEGVLMFQVVIEQDGLNSEDYIKIFIALQELVKKIGEVLYGKEEEYKTDIILLDSGSDTNVGIKTKTEIAKAIFDLFKEVWDYITSFSFNRQDRKNKALLESLSIRTEIQNKVDQGTISEEEAQEYMHYIKTRTDKLIGLKTLPKQIVLQTNNQPNRNLLEDLKVKGLLTGGNENED